jgi:hypothetical protein
LFGKAKSKRIERSYHWTEYEKQLLPSKSATLHDTSKNARYSPNPRAMPLIRLRGEPEKDGKMDEGQACKSAYFVAYRILSA